MSFSPKKRQYILFTILFFVSLLLVFFQIGYQVRQGVLIGSTLDYSWQSDSDFNRKAILDAIRQAVIEVEKRIVDLHIKIDETEKKLHNLRREYRNMIDDEFNN